MHMRHLHSLFALLTSATLSAQALLPSSTVADIASIQRFAAIQPDPQKLTDVMRGSFPAALINGRCMVGFLGKKDGGPLPSDDEQVLIGGRIGDIVSFRLDAYHLERLRELPGLAYAELASVIQPTLDKVVRDIRADSVQQGINLPQSYTGRDVLIGVPDFGFEYAHPMFYDTAMTQTRILAAWDQYKQSGPMPTAYDYGTEYATSAEVIAADHDTIEDGAYDTHGTHTAGIVGGGGAGTNYRGIAFDAKYLFVSMHHDFAAGLDALLWLQQKATAEQKRLVVNISWGAVMEVDDGHSLFSQALDLLSDQGVMLVVANGNFGGGHFHVQHTFAADTLRTRIGFSSPDPTYVGQRVALWGEAGVPFSTSLTIRNSTNAVLAQLPWVHTDAALPFMDTAVVLGSDTVFVHAVAEQAHPITDRPNVRLLIRRTNTSRRIDLNVAGGSGTVHAWNALWWNIGYGWFDQGFTASMPGYAAGDDEYAVGEPACANSVLSVGAYASEVQVGGGNWTGGEFALFSSLGPTIDDRLKPEITAPGVNVASSLNSHYTLGGWPSAGTVDFQGHTYRFGRASGTSMAAPAVTGVAAMLLEAMPFATPAQIKQAIMDNARTDDHTGPIPPEGSIMWGMGKVNAYRAAVELLGVAGMHDHEQSGPMIWPNPASDALNVLVEGGPSPVRYALLDMTGRAITEGRSTSAVWSLDLSALPAGMYLLRMVGNEGTFLRSIVKQ